MGNAWGLKEKKNIFLHCLGSEGQAIFRTLPQVVDTDDSGDNINVYMEALMRMEKRFKAATNIVLNRFKFYTRKQNDEESFDEFLTTLRALSLHCNFGQMADEMIRDQIIVHVRNKEIQERLWVLGDPSLAEAISEVKAVEQSEKWMEVVRHNTNKTTTEEEVCALRSKSEMHPTRYTPSNTKFNDNRQNHTFQSRKKNDNTYTNSVCFRCGSRLHIASFPGCPAVNKECKNCGRLGHFSNMCRDCKRYPTQTRGSVSYLVVNKEITKHDEPLSEMHKGFVVSIIDGIPDNIMKSPTCEFQILGEKVLLMVDSGSPWTIITQDYYQEMLANKMSFDKLRDPDIIAESFDGAKINIVGYFIVELQFKGRCVIAKLYIAPKGVNVLGWRDQYKLGIILNPRSDEPVTLCDDRLLTNVATVNTEFKEEVEKKNL